MNEGESRHVASRISPGWPLAVLVLVALIVLATWVGGPADQPGDPSGDLLHPFRSLPADRDAPLDAPGAQLEVVADGLTFPRGVAVGSDGSVYVAHGGAPEQDPHGPCLTQPGEEGERTTCYMETGEIVRVRDGEQQAVVTGLPAMGDARGAFGPADVSMDPDGDLYLVIGLGGSEEYRDGFGEAGRNLGSLFKAEVDGEGFTDAERVADVAAYEFEHNPDDGDVPDSNPFAVVAEAGRQLVADLHATTVLAVDDEGGVSLEAVLPDNPQAMASGVTVGPDGAAYVTELPAGFGPDDAARVWRAEAGQAEAHAYGFTAAVDLEFGPDGSLYVLQVLSTTEGLEDEDAPAPPGRLVRVAPDGSHTVVAEEGLRLPTGLAVGRDGLYVSTCSVCGPGAGQVVRVELPEREACPEGLVPAAGFTDVPTDSVHRLSIDCLAWWGITVGVTETTYLPSERLTRAQMAQLLARAIHASDATLPADVETPFTDTEGSVHETAIAALADAGVVDGFPDRTFRPQRLVTRAQKATMLLQAVEHVLGEELTATDDHFADDDGSVHEENIDKAAEAGLTVGVGPTRFDPRAPVRRDQAASLVGRTLDALVAAGRADLPSSQPE